MRTATIAKWSALALFVLTGVGFAFAYSRGQYTPEAESESAAIAILGARVYDPAHDIVTENAVVIVEGRRISAVGDDYTPIPDGARTIDARGLTLLPGFIDAHVSISGIPPDPETGVRSIGWLPYFWKFIRKFPERRQRLIQAGITSVRTFGDPHPWIGSLGGRIGRHELAGPRIFASGPIFTAPGGWLVERLRAAGQGDTSFLAQVALQIGDTAAARIAVYRLVDEVGFVSASLEGQEDSPVLGPEVLGSIVSAARNERLSVFATVDGNADIEAALAAGVHGIEGVPADALLTSSTLADLRRRNLTVDPMLARTLHQAGRSVSADAPGDRSAHEPAIAAFENVRRLSAAGVPLLAGTGAPAAGAELGNTLHVELTRLVGAGLTPRDAIAAATWRTAKSLGVTDSLGTVAPGMLADLVAVGGDPLSDISATSDIYLVIADGQVLVNKPYDIQPRGGLIAGVVP